MENHQRDHMWRRLDEVCAQSLAIQKRIQHLAQAPSVRSTKARLGAIRVMLTSKGIPSYQQCSRLLQQRLRDVSHELQLDSEDEAVREEAHLKTTQALFVMSKRWAKESAGKMNRGLWDKLFKVLQKAYGHVGEGQVVELCFNLWEIEHSTNVLRSETARYRSQGTESPTREYCILHGLISEIKVHLVQGHFRRLLRCLGQDKGGHIKRQ